MMKQTHSFYAFGPFRLDPTQKELRRDGAVVPLAPKVLDTLLALVESAGRTVPKDELMKRVWPDTFVEEGNLSVHIFNLRRRLGAGQLTATRKHIRRTRPSVDIALSALSGS